jgi:hypothetical protein
MLGDIMTDAQYDDEDEKEKKESQVKQEKTTTFKASSSKDKIKIDSDDDETMTLLVQKMGRFMNKRGYGARKRRYFMNAKEVLCYNCNSPDHVVDKCPYKDKRYDNGELKLKKNKKEKKKKKSFTINKTKKGGGYVVT